VLIPTHRNLPDKEEDGHPATVIKYTPTKFLKSPQVQGAIDELQEIIEDVETTPGPPGPPGPQGPPGSVDDIILDGGNF
jgi:hypothetical protein